MRSVRKILRLQGDCAGGDGALSAQERQTFRQIAAGIQDDGGRAGQELDGPLADRVVKGAGGGQFCIRQRFLIIRIFLQQVSMVISLPDLKLPEAYGIRSGPDGRRQAALFLKIKGGISDRDRGDREMAFVIGAYLVGMDEQLLIKNGSGKVSRQVPVGVVGKVDISRTVGPG